MYVLWARVEMHINDVAQWRQLELKEAKVGTKG